jgi:hypothetical protein
MPEREVSQVRPALAGVEPGALVGDGRFEVRRLLRRARDKAVHLGYDRKFECEVVIDVFSNNAIMPSGLSVSAWEARVLGRLGGHPHIGTVLEHWEGPEGAFMVSRYLPGGSLHDLILRSKAAGETLPAERIPTLAEQMTDGLAHIHSRRNIHSRRILYRDLQPKNVLLDEWGNVHIVDFDLPVSLDDRTATDASGRLDIAGRADIEYMAPELKRGDPCDERADLYSLGATLFAACCGLPPHPEIVAARAARAGAGDRSRRSADRPRRSADRPAGARLGSPRASARATPFRRGGGRFPPSTDRGCARRPRAAAQVRRDGDGRVQSIASRARRANPAG